MKIMLCSQPSVQPYFPMIWRIAFETINFVKHRGYSFLLVTLEANNLSIQMLHFQNMKSFGT